MTNKEEVKFSLFERFVTLDLLSVYRHALESDEWGISLLSVGIYDHKFQDIDTRSLFGIWSGEYIGLQLSVFWFNFKLRKSECE